MEFIGPIFVSISALLAILGKFLIFYFIIKWAVKKGINESILGKSKKEKDS